MNITKAIATAQRRVSIIPQVGQYIVQTYDSDACAWRESNNHDLYHAQSEAWEDKVCIALELLEIEDAGYKAHMAVNDAMGGERPDWRRIVREIHRNNPRG